MMQSKITTGLFWVLSMSIAVVSYRFVILGMDLAFPEMKHHVDFGRLVFIIHVCMGPLALFLAPFQLSKRIRQRSIFRHKIMGRVYVGAIFIGGVSGFYISLNADGGLIGRTGFALLAIAWVVVTMRGLQLAMRGQIDLHRQWMIRSIALTFAGVTLRVYLGLIFAVGVPFEIGYPAIAWLCWVPNLVVAEVIIARGRRKA